MAALAFMAMLRFHHSRFEDGMVRTFQKQQLDAIRSWADSVEGQVAGLRGEFCSLASHPDVCRLAPDMTQILSSFLTRQSGLVDELEVLDASGARLWSGGPDGQAGLADCSTQPAALPTSWSNGQRLDLCLPIKWDGRQTGTIRVAINIGTVTTRSQPKANIAYKSLYWLLSQDGQIICGGDTLPKVRQVTYALRDADAPREEVHNAELLPYLAQRCVHEGAAGLAQVLRQDDKTSELVAFAPMNLAGQRFGLVTGSPRAVVSVPIASHERVTYALIVALALLYFATGYTAYRSERAHTLLAEHRRKAAEEASRAKGDFLAKMSHELRTPMNGIISMTALAMETSDPLERQNYLGVVKECANSLLSVVNDILDTSKIEARRLELCQAPLNLPECVANTLASLAPLARDKGLSLDWEIAPGTPAVVTGDPGRLRQILNNLVGNAIKYTSVGQVSVNVRPASPGSVNIVQLEVRDTGPGMSSQDQAKVFLPYYQCSSDGAYRKDSTGLGLAIAKQLVELMGGRIGVSSRMGQGTVFSFTARFADASQAAPLADGALPPLAGARVLAISSVSAHLARFTDIIGDRIAGLDTAQSVQAGLAAMSQAQAAQKPYGLILLDSGHSAADAFVFAEQMAALPGYEQVALAIAYPAGLRGDAESALRSGVDAYLGVEAPAGQFLLALRLALQHAASQKGRSIAGKRLPQDLPALRILLAEDNPVNQQAASIMLRQWGHAVQTAGTGQEAIALMAEQDFDLVLMDLEMPGMNGIEATSRIRRQEQPAGKHTPIVAMTAHALDGDQQRCLQAGMDGYTSKPFRPDELRRLILDVCGGAPVAARPLPPAATQETAWDPVQASRLTGGNQEALALIVGTFLEDLRQTLPAARQAASARDKQALSALAHRWKGSLGLLGARQGVACAKQLEEACRSTDVAIVQAAFEQLQTALLAVEAALSAWERNKTLCKS